MQIENDSSRVISPSLDHVLAEIKQIVGEHQEIAPAKIHQDDELEADLKCDSLDIVDITMDVEEHFGITVPDDAAEQIRTVGDIASRVCQLLAHTA